MVDEELASIICVLLTMLMMTLTRSTISSISPTISDQVLLYFTGFKFSQNRLEA